MIKFNNFDMKKGDKSDMREYETVISDTALQDENYQIYLEKQKAEEEKLNNDSKYMNTLKAIKEEIENNQEEVEEETQTDIPEEVEEEIHFIEEDEDEFDDAFANKLDEIENIQSGINESTPLSPVGKFSILSMLEDYTEDEDDYSLDPELEDEDDDDIDEIEPEKRIIYIDKSKKELTSFERLMIKSRPDEYRLGRDPNKVSIKKKKHKEKIRNMSDDELREYYATKNRKAEEKNALKFMKDVEKLKKKSKSKKYQKLQDKINKAYLAEKKLENEKCKSFEDVIVKKEVKNWEREVHYDIFFGKNKRKFDPYARYRRTGNIITVSELEDYKNDFTASYLKNLESVIMSKINEPLELKAKTTVEYYDKKGRLTTREILPESKKKKKSKKKKNKKKRRNELSPDFDDLY